MKHSLIYFGHDTLRQKADKLEIFDTDLSDLSTAMFKIMKQSNGIGLAAPQINISKQFLTIDLSSYEKEKLFLANPKIVWKSEETGPYDEGCLSIPGIFETVIRPVEIVVQGQDVTGKEIEVKADDILARVLQHEIDHLNGILFVDYLEDYIRKEYTKELKKIKKLNRAL